MTEQRSDDAAGEQRDERGRLYSVVAEGRRFYYVAQLADTLDAVSADLATAEVENVRLAASRDEFARTAIANNEALTAAVAERDSLRGVVQAVESAVRNLPLNLHVAGDDPAAHNWNAGISLAQIRLRAALAAAADAPQCQNGHPFEPGIDSDMQAEGRSPDLRWCNVCGEARADAPQPEPEWTPAVRSVPTAGGIYGYVQGSRAPRDHGPSPAVLSQPSKETE